MLSLELITNTKLVYTPSFIRYLEIKNVNMKKSLSNIFLLLISICLFVNLGITQSDCEMQIGTNFDIVGACGVHKDLKISSTHFFTRNEIYLEDGNDWDSGLAETMSQDDAGYPLEVPFVHPLTGENQIVAFTVGGYQQNYETGDYVMLYDGNGSFQFANWTAQTVTSEEPGRIEFTINEVDENGIHIEMLSSMLDNHVNNIRIVRIIYEGDFETAPFLPQFEEKANNFVSFRFMDWMYTNHTDVSQWEERTKANFHTQEDDEKGASWELVIELCNYFNIDPWINVPHQANGEYIDSMATLFNTELDTNLTIYLEYSNECWNWIFEQTYWLDSVPPFPGNIGRNYGYYANEVFTRWDNVFSGQEDRIEMILAGHDYFVLEALDYTDGQATTDLVDLVSYPGYVALNEGNYDTLNAYGNAATAEQVLAMLNENKSTDFYWMNEFKTLVSDVYEKDFVMYEGGQHITPEWFGLDTSYNQALYDAQLHPGMYSFYQDILNYYKDTLEVTLFMNFTLSSLQENPFGSWGLLDNVFLESPWPVKYQAVLDFIENCGPVVDAHIEADITNITITPNPTTDYMYINGLLGYYSIHIIDGSGNIYQNLTNSSSSIGINIESLPAGMYFVVIQHNDHTAVCTQKIIKI